MRSGQQLGLMGPGAVVLIALALLPLASLTGSGFRAPGGGLTAGNFRAAFSSDTYMTLLGRTLETAFVVTLVSIAIGWPCAWALARYVPPRLRNVLLGLVAVPYVTSQLLLIYGFTTLVQAGGPAMSLLHRVGLADAQTSIMYTSSANTAMLVYESVPTAVLIMYAAALQLDDAVLEAGRSLGASGMRLFTGVIWPLSAPQVLATFALTFVQTVGAFAEPAILAGPNGQLLGNAIAQQLSIGGSRPFAIALAVILLAASLAIVGLVYGAVAVGRARQSAWPRESNGRTSEVRGDDSIVTRLIRTEGAP